MILEAGSKVLIVHRRLFEKDKARYFIGCVDRCEGDILLVTGKTWTQDAFNGQFVKKEDVRTKVVSLSSGALFVYRLPGSVDLSSIRFDHGEKGTLWLKGGETWKMDLSENCHTN